MARYRIGNDLTILWKVYDREGKALFLNDKEVHLFYTCERGRFEADINIQEDNIVVWNFYGSLQKTLGEYSLTLEIFQSDGMRSIKKDVCGAFVFVGKDCEADVKDTTVSLNGEVVAHQEIIKTNLDVCRVSPVVPHVVRDENGIGYWYVDGVNTGDRSTGETAYEYAKSQGYTGTEEDFAKKLVEAPDWNASKGESGYIKNKPFFDNINTKIETPDVNLDETDSVSINTQRGIYEAMVVKYPVYLIETGEIVGHKLLVSYWGTQESVRIPHPAGQVDLTITINEDDQYVLVFNWITYDTIDVISDVRYGFYGGYEEELIKRIDDFYIPDTIARTKDVEETTDELREETTALWENLEGGKFPNLVAGDLYGHGESVPAEFSFRATGGKSIKDGVAYIKELQGNAVVWNQILNNPVAGLADKTETDTEVRIIPTDADSNRFGNGVNVIKGHYYLQMVDILSEEGTLVGFQNYLNLDCGNKTTSTSYVKLWQIAQASASGTSYVQLWSKEGTPYRIKKDSFNLIDLTQMFGAGDEPTTIEEYYARKPIVADEYAYNEGEVIAFNGEAVKSVGDNAWDEEWEEGVLDHSNGKESISSTRIRSKNFCRIIGGEDYYLVGNNYNIVLYDENYQWLDYWGAIGEPRMVSMDSRAKWFKVSFNANYGTTYKNDALISLYHSGWKAEVDATYKPYWADVLTLDSRIKQYFPNGMHKWNKVYNKDGKGYIVKGTGVAHLGDSEWNYSQGVFITYIADMKAVANQNVAYMAEYAPASSLYGEELYNNVEDKVFKTNGGAVGGLTSLAISDSRYTDAASFKAMLQEKQVILYYELEKPTIIELAEPFKLEYKVADFGTEELISEQNSAPFKARTIYQFNAVDQIRENYNEIEKIKAALAKAGITI